VSYGPNYGTGAWRAEGAYAWHCARCTRLGTHAISGGYVLTEVEAHAVARRHARRHLVMRAVREEV
jgi:hypothetical protein